MQSIKYTTGFLGAFLKSHTLRHVPFKSAMNHFFLFFLMFLVLNVVTNLIPKARFKAIQMELIQIHNNTTYRTWEYPHF